MRDWAAKRRLLLLAGVTWLASSEHALAQQTPTLVSGFADQSWMLNPGNRGDGPIDHGTLAGVSVMWLANARTGLDLTLSARDLRSSDRSPGPFYQGRVVSWVGFHANFFLRGQSSAMPRIRPYISIGGGLLRTEQRYTVGPARNRLEVSRENGYPIAAGGGLLAFVTPRIALRGEIRVHPGEETMARALVGGGYLFGEPSTPRARARQDTPRTGALKTPKPSPWVEVAAGFVPVFDDGESIDHAAIGAGLRWFVSSGIAIGPEVQYWRGPGDDRDLLVTMSANFDLRADTNSAGARQIVPYLVANAGLMRHWESFQPTGPRTGLVLSFGGGVRIPLGPRLFLAPEYRFGVEPQMRFMAAIGWRGRG